MKFQYLSYSIQKTICKFIDVFFTTKMPSLDVDPKTLQINPLSSTISDKNTTTLKFHTIISSHYVFVQDNKIYVVPKVVVAIQLCWLKHSLCGPNVRKLK